MKSLIKEEQPKLSRILVKIGYNLKVIKTEEICCFFSENKIVYAQTLERSFHRFYARRTGRSARQKDIFPSKQTIYH
jgi:hypothetical protein